MFVESDSWCRSTLARLGPSLTGPSRTSGGGQRKSARWSAQGHSQSVDLSGACRSIPRGEEKTRKIMLQFTSRARTPYLCERASHSMWWVVRRERIASREFVRRSVPFSLWTVTRKLDGEIENLSMRIDLRSQTSSQLKVLWTWCASSLSLDGRRPWLAWKYTTVLEWGRWVRTSGISLWTPSWQMWSSTAKMRPSFVMAWCSARETLHSRKCSKLDLVKVRTWSSTSLTSRQPLLRKSFAFCTPEPCQRTTFKTKCGWSFLEVQ